MTLSKNSLTKIQSKVLSQHSFSSLIVGLAGWVGYVYNFKIFEGHLYP